MLHILLIFHLLKIVELLRVLGELLRTHGPFDFMVVKIVIRRFITAIVFIYCKQFKQIKPLSFRIPQGFRKEAV